jgi:hypothetical protein
MSSVTASWLVPLIRSKPIRQVNRSRKQVLTERGDWERRTWRTWLGLSRHSARLSILRPLGTASALAVVALVLSWAVPGLIDSTQQQSLHRAAVHPDGTAVQTGITATIKTPIVLVYRDIDGKVHRVVADETEANRFVNEVLIYLDSECSAIKAEVQTQIAASLERAFSDRQEAIQRFADWYFAWGQSWTFLQVAVMGGVSAASISNVQGIVEGSHNAVEAYFIQNYQRLVLKPELRNSEIEAGISRILANAHARYLAVLTTIEERTQAFLSKSTRHLDAIRSEDKVRVSLDWDAQKWKARYAVGDEALNAALRGSTLITLSALVARQLGPTIDRALVETFLSPSRRVVAAMWPQIAGAVAGSAVEPGVGTLAGWLLAGGSAVALDYLSNRYHEYLDRPEFEKISSEALDVTMRELSRAFNRDLFTAVDAWFDDTRIIVAEQKIHKN